jgi:hypothetical protein
MNVKNETLTRKDVTHPRLINSTRLEQTATDLTRLTCIQKVPSSNLGRTSAIAAHVSRCFPILSEAFYDKTLKLVSFTLRPFK